MQVQVQVQVQACGREEGTCRIYAPLLSLTTLPLPLTLTLTLSLPLTLTLTLTLTLPTQRSWREHTTATTTAIFTYHYCLTPHMRLVAVVGVVTAHGRMTISTIANYVHCCKLWKARTHPLFPLHLHIRMQQIPMQCQKYQTS